MAEEDPEYAPPEANEHSPPARNLRRRRSAEGDEVSELESGRKKGRKSSPAWSTRLPNDLPSLLALKDPVDRLLKQQAYAEGDSLRVIRAALTMQEEWLVDLKKKGEGDRGKRIPKPNVRERVCKLLGLSPVTYGNIMGEYLQRKKMYVSVNGGNTRPKKTRIPMSTAVQIAVRDYVREPRASTETDASHRKAST
jgi:hypothetical protein